MNEKRKFVLSIILILIVVPFFIFSLIQFHDIINLRMDVIAAENDITAKKLCDNIEDGMYKAYDIGYIRGQEDIIDALMIQLNSLPDKERNILMEMLKNFNVSSESNDNIIKS